MLCTLKLEGTRMARGKRAVMMLLAVMVLVVLAVLAWNFLTPFPDPSQP